MIEGTRFTRALDRLLDLGVPIFAFALTGFGVETLVCAHRTVFLYPLPSHPRFKAIPVLPFLPPIPWLAYLFGAILVICGAGLLFELTRRASTLVSGSLLFFCTLILAVPRSAAIPGSMGLRTVVFEPLAIACLAWLLPGIARIPPWLSRTSRFLLSLSLIVFGVDHFLALAPIGALIPRWIPWHVFWVAFFGAGFIAAGVGIAFNLCLRWAAACLGLMYAIWVFSLHLPTVLGTYVITGRSNLASLWSSLLIAVSLWGGSWALSRGHGKPMREGR